MKTGALMTKSVWSSYVVDAEAVVARGDLGDGEEGHGGLIIIGHGVAITDLIMDRIIARGRTDLDRDGGDMVRIGEDLIGAVPMEEVTITICHIRPMVLIPGMATDIPIQ
jgi:hypothetical protein